MIVIDGNKSELESKNFENLEQIFLKVAEGGLLKDRVITDVFLNNELFSEIYPHQSEDIDAAEVKNLEIRSSPVAEIAVDITRELYKVVNLMGEGGGQVAAKFRQADDAEALELYQDLLDVTRSFIGMVAMLRDEFSLKDHPVFMSATEELTNLFSEMTEVLENEDWILLADLLEYEYLPAVEHWKKVIAQLREDIRATSKG